MDFIFVGVFGFEWYCGVLGMDFSFWGVCIGFRYGF